MKIAVISDIHGNMEALNAVLDNIKNENCEKIFCLGDLSMAGPEPSLTLNKIKELSKDDNFILIQGNTDEMLGNFSQEIVDDLKQMNQIMANAYLADIEELSEEDKSFLANLDKTREVTINGINFLLVHGSPRKNNENIFPDLPIEEVEEIIKSTDADVILCGHTHLPCGYQTNTNQTIVNAGSIGRPFSEDPFSCYVIINISEDSKFVIKHNFVSYDVKTASEKLSRRSFMGANKLARMLEKATSRYPTSFYP